MQTCVPSARTNFVDSGMVRPILIAFFLLSSALVAKAQAQSAGDNRLNIRYYEKADIQEQNSITAIISASLSVYLDRNIETSGEALKWSKNTKEILKDLNSIVTGSVRYYRFREMEKFKGFSDDVKQQIEKIGSLRFADDREFNVQWTEDEIKRRRYIFYRKEIDFLELLMNTEIGYYASANLLSLKEQTAVEFDPEEFTYDPEALLEPEEIKLNDASLQLLNYADESSLDLQTKTADTTLFGELRALLVENNNRMNRLEDQVNAMRIDQLEWMDQQNKERDQMLQAQIDDLKGMVLELVRINTGVPVAENNAVSSGSLTDRTLGDVANVPSFIDVYFNKSSAALSVETRLVLSEVVDIAVRNPHVKILLTGMADKSGKELTNLLISQERALAVRKFLVSSGLEETRFVIRYTGSSKSDSEKSTDRKVRLEFIM